MKVTVLGSSGFIGSHLVSLCRGKGLECVSVDRNGVDEVRDPGHVIDCIGLTADFRTRHLDAVDAHVKVVTEFFRRSRFESFLYLSSTRLYRHASSTREDAKIWVDPAGLDDLYNLSKLMGEAICLNTGDPSVRVARLSNVYGSDYQSDNFLPSVIRAALKDGKVHIANGRLSEKDYVFVEDVVDLLLKIATKGKQRIYNVASGYNLINQTLGALLQQETSCRLSYAEPSEAAIFPVVDISRIQGEFGFEPVRVEERLGELVKSFRRALV